MARINTNVASLTAQRGLAKIAEGSERHAAAPVQRPADQPRRRRPRRPDRQSEGLRSEISGINQAIDNSSRASNVIATAEGALGEVASLLLNIKEPRRRGRQHRRALARRDRRQPAPGRLGRREHHPHQQHDHVRGAATAQRQPRLHHQRRDHRRHHGAATCRRPTSARTTRSRCDINVITSAQHRRAAVHAPARSPAR